MLSIREAFKFVISEYGKQITFWTELCVLYVVWVNFASFLRHLEGIGTNWGMIIVVQLVELVLYAGIINIAILASSKQEYALKYIVVKGASLGKFLVVAVIPAIFVSFLTFLLAHATGLAAALLGIILLLGMLLFFVKFSFVLFYIIGENTNIISSIKQSWALSNCPVVMSLILYFLAMIIAVLPLSLIDMFIAPCHISIVSYITPLGLLALGHLFQQAIKKVE